MPSAVSHGTRNPHGFVIVKMGSEKYICDPELEMAIGRNLYKQKASHPRVVYGYSPVKWER